MSNLLPSKLIPGIILALTLCITGHTKAQKNEPAHPGADTSRFATYRENPVWKDMINDQNVNYFEVQKAFELFWCNKEMPAEEDEIIGEKRKLKNNLINRTFNSKELKEQQQRDALSFDCKRYRWWLIKTEPYVQDDGSIMSLEKRLELWKKHYEELNGQSTK
jgi:hypothetical protein